MKLKIPREYWPVWLKNNLEPHQVDISNLGEGDLMPRNRKYGVFNKNIQGDNINSSSEPEDLYKKSAKVISVSEGDDKEEVPKIKYAKFMQNPQHSMWYETSDSDGIDPKDMIDNNDYVDIESIQRMPFVGDNIKTDEHKTGFKDTKPNNKDLTSVKLDKEDPNYIKKSFENKRKPIFDYMDKPRVAGIGEYVVMFRNKVVAVCATVEELSVVCEDVLFANNDLEKNDLIILQRLSVANILGF